MKGYIGVLLVVAAFAVGYFNRETIITRLTRSAQDGGNWGKFETIRKFRPPEPISGAEYLKWGLPGVDSPWGLNELKTFAAVLAANLEEHPDNLPSAESDYGIGVFSQIKSMTERSASVHWEHRMEFFTLFRDVFDTYDQAASFSDYRYDQELALMSGLMMRVVAETLDEAEQKEKSLRVVNPTTSVSMRRIMFGEAYSAAKGDFEKFCRRYFEVLEYRNFSRPKSRQLMAAYLNEWFPEVSRILNLNYHARVRSLHDRETDSQTAEYYADLAEKMKRR